MNDFMVLKNKIGMSERHSIDSGFRLFHTTQHVVGNGEILLKGMTAREREYRISEIGEYYGVYVIHSLVMPDHTHDIVFCNDVSDVGKMYRALNISTVRNLRRDYPEASEKYVKFFSTTPRYKPIANLRQYFTTAKYVFNNPAEDMLERTGFDYPYSSFAMMKNGFVPNSFPFDSYEKMFGIKYETLMEIIELPLRWYLEKLKFVLAARPETGDPMFLNAGK